MARRGQESFQKRAREKARQDKQAEKRAKRHSGSSSDDDGPSRASEDALMEEFARLSARFAADQMSTEQYNEERQRIFDELGLEADE